LSDSARANLGCSALIRTIGEAETCGWTFRFLALCEDRVRLTLPRRVGAHRELLPSPFNPAAVRMYGRRETGDKEADGRTTLAYTWPCNHRLRKPIACKQSAPLPLTQVPTHSCVSARKQARSGNPSDTLFVCPSAASVARQPQGPWGRVASCLILTAYLPAVYVPLDLQQAVYMRYTTAAAQAGVLHNGLLCFCIASTHRSKCAHISCNSLMTRRILARAYPTVRCSSCHIVCSTVVRPLLGCQPGRWEFIIDSVTIFAHSSIAAM
jgi:hypothetical protein